LHFVVGHQALFASLKQISEAQDFCPADRKTSLDLLKAILNDSFLFLLHFHHDLQESVSGNPSLLEDFVFVFNSHFRRTDEDDAR
jgi:hypothetical protein